MAMPSYAIAYSAPRMLLTRDFKLYSQEISAGRSPITCIRKSLITGDSKQKKSAISSRVPSNKLVFKPCNDKVYTELYTICHFYILVLMDFFFCLKYANLSC